nr:class I SAM-dependent methyltransferase [Methanosarcina horonobensis]
MLDVGCGPGFFSIILSQAGHQVTGVDCAAGMLERARLNAEFSGVSPNFFAAGLYGTAVSVLLL